MHLLDVDVDVAKMPLQILKLNHIRHLLLFKIQNTHTHRQAGKGRRKRVNGKGKLFIRAMAGSGGSEDLGRPVCQRLDEGLDGMTWRMVCPNMVGPGC